MKWRNSSLSCLQRCPEAFRREYIEGEKRRPTPQTVRGSAVHRLVKVALRRKKAADGDNAVLPNEAESKDLAASFFETGWADSDVRIVDPDEDGENLKVAKAKAKDTAVNIGAFYVANVATVLVPTEIERQIIVRPRNSDLEIQGTLDIVTKAALSDKFEMALQNLDPDSVAEAIRDTKTGEKAPKKTAANESQQLSMYALVRAAEVGTVAEALTLDHVIQTPNKKLVRYYPQVTTRDALDLEAIVNRLNVATEAVEKGTFLPADPSSWFCNERFCDWWTTCPYTRRSRRPTN